MEAMQKKLYKSRDGNKIDGVCRGMAIYFKMDPTTMRLIWAAGLMFGAPFFVPAYLLCALIIPREPSADEL